MEPALHGAHRDAEHVGRLAVFHALVVDQHQCTLERFGEVVDGRADPFTGLLDLHLAHSQPQNGHEPKLKSGQNETAAGYKTCAFLCFFR